MFKLSLARQNENHYKKNLTKVVLETVLTSIGCGFSVASMTVFWNCIGMNQEDIGFVQMIFTIVIGFLDIPMGYLADRFNRKILNVIGDIGSAFSFIIYAFSNNMITAIISEILLGVFMAMTNGVDQSFIKSTCDKIDQSGRLFKKVNLKVYTARYIVLLFITILGGFIAKISLRLCIGISFIPYFLGGIIASSIKDYGENIKSKNRRVLKGMIEVLGSSIKSKKTRLYLLAYGFSREITHSQIWIFTPLMLLVGIPIEIVSIGWALSYVMQIIGSMISQKFVRFKLSTKFVIPVIIEFAWIVIISVNLNIVTVWLFALNGMVQGLISNNMLTALQESAKEEVQTSLMSIASTFSRMLYIPLICTINYLGNINLVYGLLGVIAIFTIPCICIYLKLKREEKQ